MKPQVEKKGFAETPTILQYDGPQMEDYPDWNSWYLARQVWVTKRMGGDVNPRMEEAVSGRIRHHSGSPGSG